MGKIKSFEEFNESKKNWMQDVKKGIDKKGTKGSLRKELDKKPGEKIKTSEINKEIKKIDNKKNPTSADKKEKKRLVLARTFAKSKKK